MSRVWWLTVLTVNICVCAFAQEGPLPLRAGGGAFGDSQVSARRQRLVQLLAELIERHGPLGVWTHLDEGSPVASRGGDRRLSNSWIGRDDFRGGGGVHGIGSVSLDGGILSGGGGGRPTSRVNIQDDESDFYDRNDEGTGGNYRNAGNTRVREPNSQERFPGYYGEPRQSSSRGSKLPSRGDSFHQGGSSGLRDDSGPINISGSGDRPRINKETNTRRVSGRRKDNADGVIPRRDGLATGNTLFQPGEDCDEDESINNNDQNRPTSVSLEGGISSRKKNRKPSSRIKNKDDENAFYDQRNEGDVSNRHDADSSSVRIPNIKETPSRLYIKPLEYPSRGSKVPSQEDDSDRLLDGRDPIRTRGDGDRSSINKDTNRQRGGGRPRGNTAGEIPRRNGVPTDNTLFQPGEDCDEDEGINDYDQDGPTSGQGSESFKPSRGNQVPKNPVSRPGRPKSRPKPTSVDRPTAVRPGIRTPSSVFEPPYSPPSSIVNTVTPASTRSSSVGGNELVTLLIRNWQEETRKNRQKLMNQISPSSDENYFDGYSYDNIPSDRIPETPLWQGSFKLRGVLSTAVAGYNETYTMWYNGDTSESRIDFNSGTATCLRLRTPNGSYRLSSTERMELPQGSKRMCRIGTGVVLSKNEMRPPALPDMKAFKFTGLLNGVEKAEIGAAPSDARVERWQHVVRAKEHASEDQPNGEENLVYRHEMIVARRPYGTIPLRYSVIVDSSILGAASDVYMHKYHEFEQVSSPQEHLNFNFETGCDDHEEANISDPEQRAALEPLREFTDESRGPLYGVLLVRYKIRFVRQYYNFNEDTLRKNILMQKTRFVASVNRRGETFRLEINFLADRLRAEVSQLFGALPFQHGESIAPPVPFPYDRSESRRRARDLPRAFDWREKGAISPVEFQGERCMSCWAFAVTAAIEGGLFARSGRKLTLSKQCLVDCGHKTSANGCEPTWPKHAYEYVRRHGLPTNSSYPYVAEKRTCRAMGLSPLVYIRGHVDVTNHSVNALKIAIYENGPVVVIIDAMSQYFQLYKSGVLGDPECGKRARDTNHAVLAVGWGENDGKTHFILKNSWSEAWGDSGYVKLNGFANACGVLTQPSYPLEPRLEGNTNADSSSAEDDYLR